MKTSTRWTVVLLCLAMSWSSKVASVAQDNLQQDNLQQRIQSKAREAQKLAQELVAQGQPPVKQVARMKTVPQLTKRGDFEAVEELLDEVLGELRTMAQKKGPSMTVDVSPRVDTKVIDCGSDPRCTEIFIEGDLHARQADGTFQFFRGYADPDLAYDPATRTVWLTYSWLHVSNAGGGVQSHVAKLKGDKFHYVRTVNRNEKAMSPKGTAGWLNHEVASLARRPDGQWELLWLTYHRGPKTAYEGGLFSIAPSPARRTHWVMTWRDGCSQKGLPRSISLFGTTSTRSLPCPIAKW
ncbi:hypothetical protein V7x_43470 [Crateriforma conspicua]|uniref:Uncharacterized protein n=1 Tax=Crateriforma conspicua TaxID=2527996 RepID=A0A5C6FN57_9PLAN|nr:OmpH family outer membrane protein [Crateriforma conspicua]TWU62612.1 hypothetical protein V7x_43470 [Crateriforma conspicua]